MQKQAAMTSFEWALLLILSVLWGGAFFFSKVALAEVPPLTVVLARVGLAALALAIYLRVIGAKIPRSKEVWLAFFGMGLINNLIPFSLIFWGQTQIASGLASIINATTPVFSILVAHFLTADEKMNGNKIAGIALGIAGVAVLMGPRALLNDGPPLIAMLACLAAALSYGFASVFGRRFKRMNVAPAVVAFGQVTATTLMMIPIVALIDAPWNLAMPSAVTFCALASLAVPIMLKGNCAANAPAPTPKPERFKKARRSMVRLSTWPKLRDSECAPAAARAASVPVDFLVSNMMIPLSKKGD